MKTVKPKVRKITYSTKCDFCGAGATLHSGKLGENACLKCACSCCDFNAIEVWICCHTKKCGWQGQWQELNFVRQQDRISELGKCPLCGSQSFYLRNLQGEKI